MCSIICLFCPQESPADYVAIEDSEITFAANQMQSCIDVNIQDDNVLERKEVFKIHLKEYKGLNDRIMLSQAIANVSINDDGELQLYIIALTVICVCDCLYP